MRTRSTTIHRRARARPVPKARDRVAGMLAPYSLQPLSAHPLLTTLGYKRPRHPRDGALFASDHRPEKKPPRSTRDQVLWSPASHLPLDRSDPDPTSSLFILGSSKLGPSQGTWLKAASYRLPHPSLPRVRGYDVPCLHQAHLARGSVTIIDNGINRYAPRAPPYGSVLRVPLPPCPQHPGPRDHCSVVAARAIFRAASKPK